MKIFYLVIMSIICLSLNGCILISLNYDVEDTSICCYAGQNYVAEIGDYIVGYYDYESIIYTKKIGSDEIQTIQLDNDGICSVAASDNYLYLVYEIIDEFNEEDYYLQIYDEKLNLLTTINDFPFWKISYSDGYIYAMHKEPISSDDYRCDIFDLYNVDTNIIASKYIEEAELWNIDLSNIDEWHELTGDVVELGDTTLYQYDGEFWDSYDFYRNAVPYPMVRYVSYITKSKKDYYCRTLCSSVDFDIDSYESEFDKYESEIFDVIGINPNKKAYGFCTIQDDQDVYAICNLFSDRFGYADQDCKHLEETYLLKYNLETEKFEIQDATNKFKNYFVAYFDGEHVLYRDNYDLVYENNLTGEKRVLYSSQSKLQTIINDGVLSVIETKIEMEGLSSDTEIKVVYLDKLW